MEIEHVMLFSELKQVQSTLFFMYYVYTHTPNNWKTQLHIPFSTLKRKELLYHRICDSSLLENTSNEKKNKKKNWEEEMLMYM